MEELLSQGADTLILGCTELPLAFSDYGFTYPSLDPTEILAKSVVKAALA